jgi:hypothetical protein
MTRFMWKRIVRAAEMRARAASWTAVAFEVRSSPEACSRWPKRYPAEWQQAYDAARCKAVYDAHIEAVQTLKDLLHSKDERIRAKSAELLKRYARSEALA